MSHARQTVKVLLKALPRVLFGRPAKTYQSVRPGWEDVYMMLPPDDLDPNDFQPYDIPRGSCPRCQSNDIRHLVIGLPVDPEAMNSTPQWIDWGGCVGPEYDRSCDSCGFAWTFADPTVDAIPSQ